LAAAAFACGIWLVPRWQLNPVLWAWLATALACCTFFSVAIKRLLPAQLSAVLALICAGAFARMGTPEPHPAAPPAGFLNVAGVDIVGHVTNDGALLAGGGPRERFDLQTESMELNGVRTSQPIGIRVTVFSRQPSEESQEDDLRANTHLQYGARIHMAAKVHLPRNFGNPGAFDYEGYLHGQGISTLASVNADGIELLPGVSGTAMGFWRSRIRNSILEHVRGSRLWSKEDSAIFAAMIMGDDSMLMRDVREEFQQTGVYHLLVVSGMNVALLAFAILWLARRLHLPEWPAALLTIALSVFYAYIVGMGVPIKRAVLMLSLVLLGRLLFRNRSALNATGFAGLVVLTLSPTALFDAGFQLTFLALLAITGISLPILQRTSAPYRSALRHLATTGCDLTLDPRLAQFRLDLRLVAGRLRLIIGARAAQVVVAGFVGAVLAIFELVVVSSVTQAVLVLPMRAYFHRAAILGIAANVLVLPLSGLMLNGGVIAIALSYVSQPFARIAAAVAAGALHWTLACLHVIARFHLSQWRVPDPTPLLALLAIAGVLLAFFAVRRSRGIALAGLAALFLSSWVVAVYRSAPHVEAGKLEITAIDVGQGDSLLVVSPEGRTMLVDGGGSVGPVRSEFDFGEDVVAPYLWSRGLERLDVVALTHAHGDHIGGLPRIIEDFHPQELWVGVNPRSAALLNLFEVAQANQLTVRTKIAGEQVDWGGTRIRVLSPPPEWQPSERGKNNASLALLIAYKETRALLAGDLEKKMEQFVATESPEADVLKVAHHGSATSTTPELLAAVHPRFAVISAGYQNPFQHPRQAVLDRLQAAQVQVYRTDLQGAVTFVLDGKQVVAHVQQR
jgi:competence protein ComEC